jgi:hypothetical protein
VELFGGSVPAPAAEPSTLGKAWKLGHPWAFLIDLRDAKGKVALRIHYMDAAAGPPDGTWGAAPPDGRDVDVRIGCVPGYDFVDGYLASILRWGNVQYVIAAHWEDFLRPWGEDLRPVPVILSEKKLGQFVDAIEAELSTKSRGVQPHLGRAVDSGPRGPNWSLPVPGETLQFRAGPRPAAPALGGAR